MRQPDVTLSVDPNKVRGLFRATRKCILIDMLSGDVMIGGPCQIVEVDESKFGIRGNSTDGNER